MKSTDVDQTGNNAGTAAIKPLFLIHDPGKLWLVESGNVDVFLVEVKDGEPVGARHHVLRVGEGGALFGFGDSSSSPMLLVAAMTADTRVLEISQQHAHELLSTPADAERITRSVEKWVTDLSRAAAGDALPKNFEFLEPGKILKFKQAKAVVPREGVVWVLTLEGNATFLGNKDFPLSNGRSLLPIPSSAWLEVEKNCQLSVLDTADFFKLDPLWTGLHGFQSIILEHLTQKLQLAQHKEMSRLERRDRSERSRLDFALRLLASPLELEKELPAQEGSDEDPWLLACRALEKALAIRFQPPPDWRKGITPRDPAEAIARASGVRVRRVALKGNWWKQDCGPLLAVQQSDRNPVALLNVSPRKYRLYDPRERTQIAVDERVSSALEPFAWQFYRPFPQRKLGTGDLIRFGFEGCRRDLAKIVWMGVASGLLALVPPVITGIVFDSIIPAASRPQLLQVFLLMGVVAVCISLFRITQSLAMLRLEGKMDFSTQAAVWDRLLSLPVPFFRNYTAGDLAMRALSISGMRQLLTGSVLSSIFSGIFSIFSFALLFYYSWKLALLASALTLVALAATIWIGYLEVRYQRDVTRIKGHLSGLLLQFINGISKLRVSGTENRAFAAWAREFTQQKRASFRARKITVALAVCNSAFPVLCSVAVFLGLFLLMDKERATPLSTGDFLAFNAAFIQFQTVAMAMASALVSLLAIVPLYERAKPILETLPEVSQAKSHPGELSGNIEVKHLSFRYRPDTPLVLRDVSLRVPAGRFVAIIGPSGSGKSTLFRMLLGFDTPESGSIYFDGQDQAHLDIQAVRQQIGVVLQGGRILGESIYKNIVGAAPLTIDDAWEAARMAGLEADIKAMPMGIHTMIAEGGGGLSGGQRQRLMIARAIVRKPRILLFDEATSALDNETQAIVSRNLERLQATRIVIAHRLSTVANTDYIYVMERGRLVQEGAYADLLQREGPFAELARRQIA